MTNPCYPLYDTRTMRVWVDGREDQRTYSMQRSEVDGRWRKVPDTFDGERASETLDGMWYIHTVRR